MHFRPLARLCSCIFSSWLQLGEAGDLVTAWGVRQLPIHPVEPCESQYPTCTVRPVPGVHAMQRERRRPVPW